MEAQISDSVDFSLLPSPTFRGIDHDLNIKFAGNYLLCYGGTCGQVTCRETSDRTGSGKHKAMPCVVQGLWIIHALSAS